MGKNAKHFIHGKAIEGRGPVFSNISPSSGKKIGDIPQCTEDELNQALESSLYAQKDWNEKTPAERGRILQKTAQILRERNEEICKIEVTDTGKPIKESLTDDVMSAADALEYFGGIAASIHGTTHQLGRSFAYTKRVPLGVCAGIGAWNYPIQIAGWKSAPALACGNAIIFKPAELTPRSAVELAQAFIDAGAPEGVFNVVQGDAKVGQALTKNPKIAKVSLTGEVETGKRVMQASAETLKHITLELGGKSPLIIFEDADLDQAVEGAILANFYTQGEVCSNGTRVFIHSSIKEKFLIKLVEKTKSLKVGDPYDPSTEVGALISEDHLEKVMGYIRRACDQSSAKLLCGGERVFLEGRCEGGFFVQPTIFDDCTDEMEHVREEIFGPVMSVLSFDDEAEVIRRSNDTPYGLAAGIFTKDLNRAHRVSDKVQAGMCWINHFNLTPVEIPFGPMKQSGFGRENGLAAIESYSQLKTVYIEGDKI